MAYFVLKYAHSNNTILTCQIISGRASIVFHLNSFDGYPVSSHPKLEAPGDLIFIETNAINYDYTTFHSYQIYNIQFS